jgi:uncharacterized protein YjcR
MALKNYVMSNVVEKKSKLFTQKSMEIIRKDKKVLTLKEVKELAEKEFNKMADKVPNLIDCPDSAFLLDEKDIAAAKTKHGIHNQLAFARSILVL